jgi:hypothetical protein
MLMVANFDRHCQTDTDSLSVFSAELVRDTNLAHPAMNIELSRHKEDFKILPHQKIRRPQE